MGACGLLQFVKLVWLFPQRMLEILFWTVVRKWSDGRGCRQWLQHNTEARWWCVDLRSELYITHLIQIIYAGWQLVWSLHKSRSNEWQNISDFCHANQTTQGRTLKEHARHAARKWMRQRLVILIIFRWNFNCQLKDCFPDVQNPTEPWCCRARRLWDGGVTKIESADSRCQ